MTTAAVDFSAGWQEAWDSVLTVLPKIVLCLVILVVGYLVARLIENLLDRFLARVGFDRLVERGGIRRALESAGTDATHILGRIVFYGLMLIVLATAFGVFGPNPVSDYLDAAVAYLPKLFVAVLIVVIAAAIATAVRTVLRGTLGGLSYGDLLAGLAAGLIVAIGVVAALNQLEIAPYVVNGLYTAALVAIVGVVVVAVGGGGIEPMRERWREALRTYDDGRRTVMEERRAMRNAGYSGERSTPDSPTVADVRGARATSDHGTVDGGYGDPGLGGR
ncbi:MAG: hypothetical protein U0R68_06485 [Candidatus Nanopelagicales bacterium]